MTAQQLINQALRSIGALASGESPSTAESDDALVALNHLIASWSAQALPIYEITRSTMTLTGAASYELAGRPIKIKAAAVVAMANQSIALTIATPQQWAAFTDKAAESVYGEMLLYTDGYPLGTIHIAPKATGTLELLTERTVGESGLLRQRETFSVTGAASYTIGVGGTFATERPARITAAAIAAGSTVTRGVRIVSAEAWSFYDRKGDFGSFAEVLYYDGDLADPTIRLAPSPEAGTLELYTYEALATLANLSANITFPEGYERALSAALAAELAPEYGRSLEGIAQKAEDAKASIFGLNAALFGPPQPAAPGATAPPAEGAPTE